MKIGIICEGGNTDAPVIKLILEHRFQGTDVKFHIQGVSKKDIFGSGDVLLLEMFNNGADRALIIWDLLPTGLKMGVASQWSEKPSRAEQRQMLLRKLCASEVLPDNIRQQAHHLNGRYGFIETQTAHPNGDDDFFKLACVCYALEGWLITDKSVLHTLASSKAREAEKASPPHPDRCQKPATWLGEYFGRSPNKRLQYYNKSQHNTVIAQAYLENGRVDKMRKSDSFCRVVDAIEAWIKR